MDRTGIRYLVFVFLFISLFGGCSIAYKKDVPKTNSIKATHQVGEKQSISIVVGGEGDLNVTWLKGVHEQIIKAYKGSENFSEIKPGFSNADLSAEIKVNIDRKIKLTFPVLTNITLSLFPHWETSRLGIRTVFKERTGKVIGEYTNSGEVGEITQFFLLFALGAPDSDSVTKETFYNLTRLTINQALKEGIFNH